MFITIIFKTIMLYILVIMIYRLSGKKEISQLNIIDLIVFILIAELIALSIGNDKSLFFTIVPIIVLFLIQLLFSYVSNKNNKIKQLIDGETSVVIKNGQLNFKEMIRHNYNLEDIIKRLNEQGIQRIEDVKMATIDKGKFKIIKKGFTYPVPIILDGKIDYLVLKEIKRDIDWLNQILYENNLKLNDIFYAFYIDNRTFIIKKGEHT